MTLQLIAARANNNVIGSGPDIPWKAKGEQKLFKEITQGGVLIMGRKTFDSIGRPLPGRQTIIVTRNPSYQQDGCQSAPNLAAAIALARAFDQPIFVAGGGDIYGQAISIVDDIHLTTIDVAPPGDVFFPSFNESDYTLVSEQHFETNLSYTYQHFRKINQV